MFKAPIKVLHPLLTATQEGNYLGTESFGAFPYHGIVLAHSNEAEWHNFKSNKNNEAFLDRICVIKVPYCLRVTEEQKIYEKLMQSSELSEGPCAPQTLDLLARFCVPKAKSAQEYRDAAGVDEGMTGVSTRFAFKVNRTGFGGGHFV